jgi:hypothetical protein
VVVESDATEGDQCTVGVTDSITLMSRLHEHTAIVLRFQTRLRGYGYPTCGTLSELTLFRVIPASGLIAFLSKHGAIDDFGLPRVFSGTYKGGSYV